MILLIILAAALAVPIDYNPSVHFNSVESPKTYCHLNCHAWRIQLKNPVTLKINQGYPICHQYDRGTRLLFESKEEFSYKKSAKRLKIHIQDFIKKNFEKKKGLKRKIFKLLDEYYQEIRKKCSTFGECDYFKIMNENPISIEDIDPKFKELKEFIQNEFINIIQEDEKVCGCLDILKWKACTLKNNCNSNLAHLNQYFPQEMNKLREICSFEKKKELSPKGEYRSCQEVMKSTSESEGVFKFRNGREFYCKDGWTLVRRMYHEWAIQDKLSGDENYGIPSQMTYPNGKTEWSQKFSDIPFELFKFSTGDESKFVIVKKNNVYKVKDHGFIAAKIIKSHFNQTYTVHWDFTNGPRITSMNFNQDVRTDNHDNSILYAEQNLDSNLFSLWRENHEGLNVWIK